MLRRNSDRFMRTKEGVEDLSRLLYLRREGINMSYNNNGFKWEEEAVVLIS